VSAARAGVLRPALGHAGGCWTAQPGALRCWRPLGALPHPRPPTSSHSPLLQLRGGLHPGALHRRHRGDDHVAPRGVVGAGRGRGAQERGRRAQGADAGRAAGAAVPAGAARAPAAGSVALCSPSVISALLVRGPASPTLLTPRVRCSQVGTGPAAGNGFEILLQAFNWESHKRQCAGGSAGPGGARRLVRQRLHLVAPAPHRVSHPQHSSARTPCADPFLLSLFFPRPPSFYKDVAGHAKEWADIGFTAVWLPPPSDSVSPQGYLPR
jgi:hypothetical protein